MKTSDKDIIGKEVSGLVTKLISFFGDDTIKRQLDKYQKSMSLSGPIYREYYLKYRHPWMAGLTNFYQLQQAGKSIWKHLDNDLKVLASDAKKISTLHRTMPLTVKQKYKRDLLDDKLARAFLFEIQMAWHYLLQGHTIEWYEDHGSGHPEFLVKAAEKKFNVECKRISVDASRKIRRCDFYRFCEKILPEIEKLNLCGSISILLKDRLHGSNQHIDELTSQILCGLKAGQVLGEYVIPFGRVNVQFTSSKGMPADLREVQRNTEEAKSNHSHAVIFAKDQDGTPVDPIIMILQSEKVEHIVRGIEKVIVEAAERQLDKETPALITCFLEDVDELSELASESSLKDMTNYIFAKDKMSHLAAVSYCSESRVSQIRSPTANVQSYWNQGLIFRNYNCKFPEMKSFKFLNEIHNCPDV